MNKTIAIYLEAFGPAEEIEFDNGQIFELEYGDESTCVVRWGVQFARTSQVPLPQGVLTPCGDGGALEMNADELQALLNESAERDRAEFDADWKVFAEKHALLLTYPERDALLSGLGYSELMDELLQIGSEQ